MGNDKGGPSNPHKHPIYVIPTRFAPGWGARAAASGREATRLARAFAPAPSRPASGVMPLRMRDPGPGAKSQLPFLGSFDRDEDTLSRSTSRRSSLKQAKGSRGDAIMGRVAASISVIQARAVQRSLLKVKVRIAVRPPKALARRSWGMVSDWLRFNML